MYIIRIVARVYGGDSSTFMYSSPPVVYTLEVSGDHTMKPVGDAIITMRRTVAAGIKRTSPGVSVVTHASITHRAEISGAYTLFEDRLEAKF